MMASKVEKIGKYEIVGILGEGAMGVVYKGLDPIIERNVAIKTIRHDAPGLQGHNIRARFIREAQAAGRIHHPNIVGVYEYDQDAERDYIVMEFVQGVSLAEHLIKHRRLDVKKACDIMVRVLGALDFAHSKGVVHRDIKPSNIMLSDSGDVKVTDFGIARIESSTLTKVGTVVGTPSYMSPEQLLGQTVDQRSDIFSAGTLLYKLLTGDTPFTGSNVTEVIYRIVHSEHIHPSKRAPDLAGEFDNIITKALAKRPEDRYQTANEFAVALSHVAAKISIPHQRALAEDDRTELKAPLSQPSGDDEWRGKAPGTQTLPTPTSEIAGERVKDADEALRTSGKNKSFLIVGVAAGLVLAAGSLWFLTKEHEFGLKPTEYESSAPDQVVVSPEKKQSDTARGALIQKTRARDSAFPGETFKDCSTCPELVVVPPGSFYQGSPSTETEQEETEGPQHFVRIGYPLAVGKHEVTKAEFAQFAEQTAYKAKGCWVYDGQWEENSAHSWRDPGFEQDGSHPVICVSWNDAQAYVHWLSNKTGETYRLLSASEWEYVARARLDSPRLWDMLNSACDSANVADLASEQRYKGWEIHDCWDDYVHTAPVGSFKANNYGLYDMLGNVFEWVQDCWNSNYLWAPTDGSPWIEGDCEHRVLRGGSWFSMPRYVRLAFRNRYDANYRSSSFGFRVARVLKQ
jgi:formylglycine-generating enzyme required for sulfatase activity/tRNA A-37 threonylcarbamoyl transferase component Bud32